MAELQEESLAEQQQEAPAEPEQAAEQTPDELSKPPKERGRLLLPFLTVLLIVIGIGEAVFWSLMGVSTYQFNRAQRLYEQRQADIEAERQSRGITGGSAYGPNWKIENGVVTWRRETELSAGSSAGTGSAQGDAGEKRLSVLSVPWIPYTLAEPYEEDVPEL